MKRMIEKIAPDSGIELHLGDPETADDICKRVGRAEVILNGHTMMDASLFDRMPSLRRIIFMGTGASSYIDIAAAAQRGILVSTVAGYGDRSVAEHAFALILAAARRVAEMDRAVRAGVWEPLEGLELAGRRVGIVGFGGIGKELAKIAIGFGMVPLIWNRSRVEDAWVGYTVSLDALLSQSDVVSLHLGLTSETRRFLGPDQFAKMKTGAILVNTARGGLIDEAALIHALEEGHIGHAALDVFDQEPILSDSPFLRFEQVTLTAHAGFKTEDAIQHLIRKAVELIKS